jgi:hypothetical protein
MHLRDTPQKAKMSSHPITANMKKILSILSLVAIGVIGRLIPHLPNATPITAISFAARRHVGAMWAFIIPVAAMVLSDIIIGFYDWRVLLSVYASFLMVAYLTRFAPRGSGAARILLATVGASLLFFGVTNFAVWYFSPIYAKTFAGLLQCYFFGLAFMRNMLIGDIGYTLLILGAAEAPAMLRALVQRLRLA